MLLDHAVGLPLLSTPNAVYKRAERVAPGLLQKWKGMADEVCQSAAHAAGQEDIIYEQSSMVSLTQDAQGA